MTPILPGWCLSWRVCGASELPGFFCLSKQNKRLLPFRFAWRFWASTPYETSRAAVGLDEWSGDRLWWSAKASSFCWEVACSSPLLSRLEPTRAILQLSHSDQNKVANHYQKVSKCSSAEFDLMMSMSAAARSARRCSFGSKSAMPEVRAASFCLILVYVRKALPSLACMPHVYFTKW